MPAGIANLTIEEGADFALGIRLKRNCETVDISDWFFAAQLRTAIHGTLLADFAVSIDSETQTLRLGIDAATTATLEPQTARWDLLAILPDSRKLRLLEGKATISGNVTEL